ncbi:MAG: hypothetical protein ACPGQL_01605 [Thermoplasmatota archaeon]
MKLKYAVATLLAVALLAPGASAQLVGSLTVNPTVPSEPIAYDGATDLPFTVDVGCAIFLEAQDPSTTVTVGIPDAPSWLSVSDVSVAADPAACLSGAGSTTLSGALSLSPGSDAVGMTNTPLTVTASVGEFTSTSTADIKVAYKMGYTHTMNLTFPYTVPEGTEKVLVEYVATVDANAPTMVMWDHVQKPVLGGMPAPFPHTFQDPVAENEFTFILEYTVPDGKWTNETVILKTWSHYLEQGDLKTDDEEIVLTFINGDTGSSGSGNGDGEDSPGVALPVLLLGLLAVAGVVARRRS